MGAFVKTSYGKTVRSPAKKPVLFPETLPFNKPFGQPTGRSKVGVFAGFWGAFYRRSARIHNRAKYPRTPGLPAHTRLCVLPISVTQSQALRSHNLLVRQTAVKAISPRVLNAALT